MKVETRIREYSSNVQGERVGMTIDQSALSHIMSVLTDLYSDPEQAVLREYSTNALDAHVQAGVRRPIDVSLPTALSPFLTIRDYGEGLDARDIREVFSRYGTSTKRESNDVVGMLGLGCKSALTYSDSFTLTSTKHGRTVEVLVSRDEDGSGSMTIVEERADSREQGTSVLIPAKRVNSFESKARAFFRFWKEGTVLVNGAAPQPIGGLRLSPRMLLTTQVTEDTVVMGNVPYPFPRALHRNYAWLQKYRIVAFVDIGEVSFTPSRESLQSTKGTTAAIERIYAEADATLEQAVRDQVTAASSASEAIRLYAEGKAAGFKSDTAPTYKGRPVPLALDRQPRDSRGNRRMLEARDYPSDSFLAACESRARYRKNGDRGWLQDFDFAIIFEGFESRELSPVKREKIALWAQARGLDTSGVLVFVKSLTADERFWLEGKRIERWSDVDAIKIPRDARPVVGGRLRGAYSAMLPVAGTHTSGVVQAADIDTFAPLYWVHGNESTFRFHDAIRLGALPAGATVVALPAGRIEKFQRDFPMSVELGQGMRVLAAAEWAKLDKGSVRAWEFQRGSYDEAARLKGLDPARIDDKNLRDAIRLSNADTGAVAAVAKRYGPWLRLTFSVTSPLPNVLRPFPLLVASRYLKEHAEHVYLYVNVVTAKGLTEPGKDGQ